MCFPDEEEHAEGAGVDEDVRHPTLDPQISPHHVINLEGSNCVIIHRYKQMLAELGVMLDGGEILPDYDDPDGLTVDIVAEVNEIKKKEQAGENVCPESGV